MNRPESSVKLNLSRNILLAIGLFNICWYTFVLNTVADTIPKMMRFQNEAMEADKKISEEEVQTKVEVVIQNARKDSWASIVGGGVIILFAFLIPVAPGAFAIAAIFTFIASLGFQLYLGFDVLIQGILMKVIIVYGFFQSVRYALEYEMRNDPEKLKQKQKHQIQFPEPDA